MTSLLLANYCVSPATSSENVGHPSFLREAGGVQAPLHTTQIMVSFFIITLKPALSCNNLPIYHFKINIFFVCTKSPATMR